MRIALWDIDPLADSRQRLSETGWNVVLTSPSHCGEELLKGNVDAALVPSIEVLQNTAAFSVLPGVGFASTRRFSNVALRINRPILEVRTVRCDQDSEPFYGLASILLREQYERTTSIIRQGEADADLVFGREAAGIEKDRRLDLGQEWFEMTGTPLTWGFFVVRPDMAPDASADILQQQLFAILRGDDGEASEENVDGLDYANKSLRLSYDPEVSDGLDELTHYLFYVGILDDIPALRLVASPE
ncbi:MAG: MqnA/MqnD/SBP family protein [Rhodothermales bacterium]